MSAESPVVLLVDDRPQSLAPLCRELESHGYMVLVAADGASALERLELLSPDAVLMDAVMPGLDGFETCRRIKANPAWRHIPVIFMTGLSETGDVVRGFEAGGVDYVVKPVRAQEVLARLATHVRNAHAVRRAQEALDVGGRGVLLVDSQRRAAWHSPRAQQWFAEYFGGVDGLDRGIAWLYAPAAEPDDRQHAEGGSVLRAQRVGTVGLGDDMWLLNVQSGDAPAGSRLAVASLTPRETEVLSWVAKGKTNRDVAEILCMSPRTVNKHLEHIFEKLGVETRSAAAALAAREMP